MQTALALFPGQGSQEVGMGKDFYDAWKPAQEIFKTADDVLGFKLSDICFEGPIEKLTSTEIVQPAILTVSIICYRLYLERHGIDTQVVAAAGHSLGEYSALVAAGAIKFEDAVMLVHKRGQYMQEAVPVGSGKMIAVLGKTIAEIEEALANISSTNKDKVQIANINAPGQTVLSGLVEAVDDFLEKLGTAKTVELAVSAPFHSKLMKSAADKLAPELDNLSISKPTFPIFCNVTGHAVSQPEEIRQALKDQVCSPVRWVECMQNAMNELSPQIALEFGNGNVLCNLLKRINKEQTRLSVNKYNEI